MKENDLLQRTFNFGVQTILLLRSLPENTELKVIRYQMIKAATSVGANYEEAQGASSKADFNNKIRIVLKEAREVNYWLRMLKALDYKSDKIETSIQESKELKNIFGAIILKGKQNL